MVPPKSSKPKPPPVCLSPSSPPPDRRRYPTPRTPVAPNPPDRPSSPNPTNHPNDHHPENPNPTDRRNKPKRTSPNCGSDSNPASIEGECSISPDSLNAKLHCRYHLGPGSPPVTRSGGVCIGTSSEASNEKDATALADSCDLMPLSTLKTRKRLASGTLASPSVPTKKARTVPVLRQKSKGKKFCPVTNSARMDLLLKRQVLRGKLLSQSEDPSMIMLRSKVTLQGWDPLFTDVEVKFSHPAIVEFFANCSVSAGCVKSLVGGKVIKFDMVILGRLLNIPCVGFCDCQKNQWPPLPGPMTSLDISRKFSGNPARSKDANVLKKKMTGYHKLLFSFVIRNLVPRQERRNAASYLDLTIMELLDSGLPINLPGLMIAFIEKVTTATVDHSLPYGFLLTKILVLLSAPILSFESFRPYDALDYFEARSKRQAGSDESDSDGRERTMDSGPSTVPTGSKVHAAPELTLLRQENVLQRQEIVSLRTQLAQLQESSGKHIDTLRAQITQLQENSAKDEKKYNNLFALFERVTLIFTLPLTSI